MSAEPTESDATRGWFTRLQASGFFSRLISLALALGTGTVLGIARWLDPSAAGHGTHLQLGLGQCTFYSATGYPCPMCGVTTTFALLADFRPVDAFVNQPFGVLMFALTAATFAIAVAEVVQPRQRWSRLGRAAAPWDPVLGIGFLVLMGLGWIYKIALMGDWF